MTAPLLTSLAWPAERLPDALRELSRSSIIASPPMGDVSDWLYHAAARNGFDAGRIEASLGDLSGVLATSFPAILALGDAYLVVERARSRRATVIAPDLRRRDVPVRELCAALRATAEAACRPPLETLLDAARLSPRRRARALKQLLDEQLAARRFTAGWVLRLDPGGPALPLLRQSGVLSNAAAMVGLHALHYVLWLVSWGLLGSLSFSGRLDPAWLLAWALLLLTLVPCQVATTWLQGLFAIGFGAFLKRRLLCGAMKLRPEELRLGGIGSFLGQALEAETVESLALSGGIAGVLALVEIALALCLLGRYAAVLALFLALTLVAGWRFLRRYQYWIQKRLALTADLIEAMVGHRTRLAQLPAGNWHTAEDHALQHYFAVSQALDDCGAWLVAALPRAWLLAGLLCLAPLLSTQQSTANSLGVRLGGILLAYTALRKLTGSFADISAAWVACRRIAPLLQAARRAMSPGEDTPVSSAPSRKILEADRLSFRYRPTGNPALQSGSLCVHHGDRILLEGPSGGGKTTFASLLSGMREPESGLLLAGGLDRSTLGAAAWRKCIAAAPQFHENHILTETLAFNLLLGRSWPPSPADFADAETICRELGLGALLDRMPAGLLQMVGEGGWQLSHGEKSRVYIARALLQSASLIILDESFAALDPETARQALEATIERAPTLLVIAHP